MYRRCTKSVLPIEMCCLPSMHTVEQAKVKVIQIATHKLLADMNMPSPASSSIMRMQGVPQE